MCCQGEWSVLWTYCFLISVFDWSNNCSDTKGSYLVRHGADMISWVTALSVKSLLDVNSANRNVSRPIFERMLSIHDCRDNEKCGLYVFLELSSDKLWILVKLYISIVFVKTGQLCFILIVVMTCVSVIHVRYVYT